MVNTKRLRKKEDTFQAFVGLTVREFDELLTVIEPLYTERRIGLLSRENRQRALGAGRPDSLTVEQKLIMVLMYLRLYVTQTLLGFLFDVDETTVGRELKRMLPILLQALPVPTRNTLFETRSVEQQVAHRVQNLADLLRLHPELTELRLDATEQPVPRPQDKGDRRERYSGKQQEHTVKTQALTSDKLVLHVVGQVPGRVHDSVVTQGSGVLHLSGPSRGQIPSDRRVDVDRGYQGVDKFVPTLEVLKPVRSVRGAKVTLFGKVFNRMVSSLRMPVEHMFAKLKKFNILDQRYRGDWDVHEDIFAVVAGLVNFRALGRLTWTL